MVVWDNRCLMHKACAWDYEQPRAMLHSRIAGDPVSDGFRGIPFRKEELTVAKYGSWTHELRTELREIGSEHKALRRGIRKIERSEKQLYRRLQRLLASASPSHIMIVKHQPGKKDRISRHPVTSTRILTALAKPGGSSGGLFCGCDLIESLPQPDGSLDVCVLTECSNEPEKTGFTCSYWCFTVRGPLVAIASKN